MQAQGFGAGGASNLREDPRLFDGVKFDEPKLKNTPQQQQQREYDAGIPDQDYGEDLDHDFSVANDLGDEA